MLFESWDSIIRVVVGGTLGYLALIVILRSSGKRTLSKMNAFDFVVTITLGSVFASLIVAESVTLADGVLALALLVLLQYAVTWISVRSERFESLVKSEPRVLYWRGSYIESTLKKERVTKEEVHAAMREHGIADHARAAAVLESDGTVSAFPVGDRGRPHSVSSLRLEGVDSPEVS